MRFSHRGSTFTVIELAIVVAIMMALAALALPSLNNALLKSKRAEAATNVDGIDVAMVAYITAFGDPPPDPVGITYPDSTTLGRSAHDWTPSVPEWPLGTIWAPSGSVRCGYHYTLNTNDMSLYAVCDVDDDELFYVDSRTLTLDQLYDVASSTSCCAVLYGSCVASNDCY